MVSAIVPSWRNWQTRMVQVHVPATVWGFESLRWHQVFPSIIPDNVKFEVQRLSADPWH
jgi:hypothetical protein